MWHLEVTQVPDFTGDSTDPIEVLAMCVDDPIASMYEFEDTFRLFTVLERVITDDELYVRYAGAPIGEKPSRVYELTAHTG